MAARWVASSLLMLLAACSFASRSQQAARCNPDGRDYVIEIDDLGAFLDPEVPACALEAIAASARRANTIVVIGVHGWHHNAAPDDEFILGFAKTLQEVRKKLDDNADGRPGSYRRSRQILTGSGDVNIFGVYVGWRGLALPGPLNYLTFWDRKNAAERVGGGDLREFLLRLNALYRASYKNRTPSTPYVGMAAIGHSFGAQVLFTAIASTLEAELIEATKGDSLVRTPGAPIARPLEGFGDIVVLLNPALEAYQYERIRRLTARLTFDRRQPPLLLVLSADSDTSRRVFFWAGRWWDSVFRARLRDEQSELWTNALGEFEPQRTHTITFLPQLEASAARYYVAEASDRACDIVNFDLTNMPTMGRVRLEPIIGRIQPHSPFIVAYGGADLIRGHSGVFEEALRSFINDYVGITRGKRLLLANPAMRECPEPIEVGP